MTDRAEPTNEPIRALTDARTLAIIFMNRDFRWVWISRLLLSAPVAAFAAYAVYFLIIRIGAPADQIPSAMLTIWTILGLTTVVVATLAGRWSDRTGRRKPFAFVGGLHIAVGLAAATLAADVAQLSLAIFIVGVGQGLYLAVELALVSQVLPDAANPAGGL